jgi:hypothetical protein
MNNYTFLETFFRLFDLKNAKPVDFVCMANAFREYSKVPEGEILTDVVVVIGHKITLYFQSGLVIDAYQTKVYFYHEEDSFIEGYKTYKEYSLGKLEGRDNY